MHGAALLLLLLFATAEAYAWSKDTVDVGSPWFGSLLVWQPLPEEVPAEHSVPTTATSASLPCVTVLPKRNEPWKLTADPTRDIGLSRF